MDSCKILIVDDDDSIRFVLQRALERDGHEISVAANAQMGVELFEQKKPDTVFLDIFMPDANGLEVLEHMQVLDPTASVIVITAHGNAQTAIEATRKRAYDYITKPFDIHEVRELAQRAANAAQEARSTQARKCSDEEVPQFNRQEMVGSSLAMQEVYKQIGRVALRDVTVLLLGESGTGKEMVARAIHRYSTRTACPFVAVNCSAIPGTLLESELFGYVRGAFTGATGQRRGKFEQANNGTLFLDEVGDLPLELQPKLLRVLQEQEFEPLGSDTPKQVDVRVIAATNRHLEESMERGDFREDLYYRLNVVPIYLPALRGRKEDIPELANHFLQRFAREITQQASADLSIHTSAMAMLVDHDWPGNVRELENMIKRAMVMATGHILLPEHFPSLLNAALDRPHSSPVLTELEAKVDHYFREGQQGVLRAEIIAQIEKPLIEMVLSRTKGNRSRAAEWLGINRNTLNSKIQEYHIRV